MSGFKLIRKGGTAEITEKKSRFIAHIESVSTEEEATAFISAKKKEYWDARHNCSAFILGENAELTRCSDDGEPPHTAGRPMLDVLKNAGLTNCVAVVTRYFGGTLLGTGGLIRAYSEAVSAGLQECVISEPIRARLCDIEIDYSVLGKLNAILGELSIPDADIIYAENVMAHLTIPLEMCDNFKNKITEATSGKTIPEFKEEVVFIRTEDGIEIL